jgi:hypothetical protein
MIRVVLPAHLRTLARIGSGDVLVEVNGEPTLRSVLDALETRYPTLRGRRPVAPVARHSPSRCRRVRG